MKNLLITILCIFTITLSAQVELNVIEVDSGKYIIETFSETQEEGQDSATFVTTLLQYQEQKQTQKGRALYNSYAIDRECTFANRELNSFTSDTSYIFYARAKYGPRFSGTYTVRGNNVTPANDTIDLIEVRVSGGIIGLPGGIRHYSNTYFELRNTDFNETISFFRDLSNERRRYVGIREDGSRIILIKR